MTTPTASKPEQIVARQRLASNGHREMGSPVSRASAPERRTIYPSKVLPSSYPLPVLIGRIQKSPHWLKIRFCHLIPVDSHSNMKVVMNKPGRTVYCNLADPLQRNFPGGTEWLEEEKRRSWDGSVGIYTGIVPGFQ